MVKVLTDNGSSILHLQYKVSMYTRPCTLVFKSLYAPLHVLAMFLPVINASFLYFINHPLLIINLVK